MSEAVFNLRLYIHQTNSSHLVVYAILVLINSHFNHCLIVDSTSSVVKLVIESQWRRQKQNLGQPSLAQDLENLELKLSFSYQQLPRP